jgi:hypothetical protein
MCGLHLTRSGYGPLAYYCAHGNYTAAAAQGMLFIDYKRLRTNCSKNLLMYITAFTSYMPLILLIYNVFESGHICYRKWTHLLPKESKHHSSNISITSPGLPFCLRTLRVHIEAPAAANESVS